MGFTFELMCSPDINKIDSYRLNVPERTSLAELVLYAAVKHPYCKVSLKGGSFENNMVLVEFRNGKFFSADSETLFRLRKRYCSNVTAFTGHATLEFVAELKDKQTISESLNYLWKKVCGKIK